MERNNHHEPISSPSWPLQVSSSSNQLQYTGIYQNTQRSNYECHLSLLNFCACTSHSLQRWSHIITTMILKKTNNYKIHGLRVIHIYEADLTALFSIWSQWMIQASTLSKMLNPGSYGAHLGHTSTDPLLISLLQNEISALTPTSLCIGPTNDP